jgi:hypothetical protein
MMNEPIDEGDERRRRLERPPPFGERPIGLFVAAADEFEHQVGMAV